MSLHLKLLDIDHPLTFEKSKLREIEAHALIYLSDLDLFNLNMVFDTKQTDNDALMSQCIRSRYFSPHS